MGGGVRVIFRLAITYLLALKFVFKVNTQLFQESVDRLLTKKPIIF